MPHMINKWLCFLGCVPVMLSSGVTYTFALWANSFKEIYELDQTHIQTLGSFCNLGGFFGIVAGLFYDKLEAWHGLGPRLTLLFGAIFNSVGYLGLWAAATGRIEPQYWQLLLLAFFACNGGTWYDASCLVTNVRNFPSNRGMVVGALKSGVGLSASLYTALYLGVLVPLGGTPSTYLLLLALAPTVIGLLGMLVINHVPFLQQSELEEGQHVFTSEGRFLFAVQLIGALAVFLMTATPVLASTPSPALRWGLLGGAGMLLLSLLLVAQGTGGLWARPAHPLWQDAEAAAAAAVQPSHGHASHRWRQALQGDGHGLEAPLLSGGGDGGPCEDPAAGEAGQFGGDGQEHTHGQSGAATSKAAGVLRSSMPVQLGNDPSAAGSSSTSSGSISDRSATKQRNEAVEFQKGCTAAPNLSPLQCLVSLDFWLLFVACCAGMGAGLTFNNNLGQLVLALGGSEDGQDVFVGLFGVMNCVGRLAVGYISEKLLHSSGVPRSLFLVGASAATAVICTLLALARLPALYPLSLAAGLVFGSHWALMPSLSSELWGLQHFAANYCLLQVAPAVGSLGLASRLAGYVYQRAIEEHEELGNTCTGQDCFRLTFLVIAGLALLATGCSTWLYLRTRELYRSVTFAAVHQHDQAIDRAPHLEHDSQQSDH